MNKRAQIAESLANIIRSSKSTAILFSARIVSIESTTCTIDVDGQELADVRLTPTISERENMILLTPAKNSFVLVGSLSGNLDNLCVLALDTIDRAELTIGTISLLIDKDGVVLNDGKLGGLVKIKDLTEKINVLEKQLNELKTVFNTWLPVPNDGGASLKTSIMSWAVQPIEITNRTDLENLKIKQ